MSSSVRAARCPPLAGCGEDPDPRGDLLGDPVGPVITGASELVMPGGQACRVAPAGSAIGQTLSRATDLVAG